MNLGAYLAKEWRAFISDAIRPTVAPTQEARETKLIERATASGPAKQFLESEIVIDFMAKAEANLTTELLACPLDDDAGRRNLAVAIQTQRQLMKYLVSLAQDGASAERELERLRSGKKDFF